MKRQEHLNLPGLIGRIVRLLLSILILYLFVNLIEWEWLSPKNTSEFIRWQAPGLFWVVNFLIFFLLFPYVVNIGFGVNWKRKPQLIFIITVVGLGLFTLFQYGSLWSPALGWLLLIWLTYVAGHLGISLILASILATPGCEMRSIPHLWTILSGRETKEHYCPGSLDKLDKWEARIREKGKRKKEKVKGIRYEV